MTRHSLDSSASATPADYRTRKPISSSNQLFLRKLRVDNFDPTIAIGRPTVMNRLNQQNAAIGFSAASPERNVVVAISTAYAE